MTGTSVHWQVGEGGGGGRNQIAHFEMESELLVILPLIGALYIENYRIHPNVLKLNKDLQRRFSMTLND